MERECGAHRGVRDFNGAHLGEGGGELGLRGEQEACHLSRRIVRHGGARHEAQRHRQGGNTLPWPERAGAEGAGRDIHRLQEGKRCAMASAASISKMVSAPLPALATAVTTSASGPGPAGPRATSQPHASGGWPGRSRQGPVYAL